MFITETGAGTLSVCTRCQHHQSPADTRGGNTARMGSLVEIKNPNEIYIHYLFDEATSDRGDSIDSVDQPIRGQYPSHVITLDQSGDSVDHSEDTVTINNCTVTSRVPVTSTEVATQVDLREKGRNKAEATKGKIIN